jgi:hypothetical protein
MPKETLKKKIYVIVLTVSALAEDKSILNNTAVF